MVINDTTTKKRPSSGRSRTPSAKAATKAVEAHGTAVAIPAVGTLHLPSKGTLAYYVTVGGLAAFGVIEWPVAAVVAVGHFLAQQRGNAVLEEFGEGLSDI